MTTQGSTAHSPEQPASLAGPLQGDSHCHTQQPAPARISIPKEELPALGGASPCPVCCSRSSRPHRQQAARDTATLPALSSSSPPSRTRRGCTAHTGNTWNTLGGASSGYCTTEQHCTPTTQDTAFKTGRCSSCTSYLHTHTESSKMRQKNVFPTKGQGKQTNKQTKRAKQNKDKQSD